MGIRRRLDEDLAARSAPGRIRLTLPVFDPAIDGENGLVVPGRVASGLGESLPIIPVAARPGHDIDARAAAEHLAHRAQQGAAVEMRIRPRRKGPVPFTAQILGPAGRILDRRNIVPTARLDQQDRGVGDFGETTGDDRTGGTGTAYDEIITGLQFGGELFLICTYA